MPALPVGTRLTLQVGPVAHGGHCVAHIATAAAGGSHDVNVTDGADGTERTDGTDRTDGADGADGADVVADVHAGRVVFVRHALPGERVVAEVTEDGGGSYLRADAVEIVEAAAGRVEPPCPFAGPGRCGGCDWQHADVATQLELKATVVHDALARFAGLDLPVTVEPLPGGPWRWRTRTLFAVDRSGEEPRLGLRRHRSHQIEPVTLCPISAPGVGEAPTERFDPSVVSDDVTGVEYVLGDAGTLTTVVHTPASEPPRSQHRTRRSRRRPPDRTTVIAGPPQVWHAVAGHDFDVAAAGFWQVHPLAASTFAATVLDVLDPRRGERVLDLYAGAGLFTAVLAGAVGDAGRVIGIESDGTAVHDATAALADTPQATVRPGRVTADLVAATTAELGGVDLVVLDPPRAGAGAEVMTAIAGSAPRAIAYVACDPVALARDLEAAAGAGYRVGALRAFDAFPMTHHVECVALCVPDTGSPAS